MTKTYMRLLNYCSIARSCSTQHSQERISVVLNHSVYSNLKKRGGSLVGERWKKGCWRTMYDHSDDLQER